MASSDSARNVSQETIELVKFGRRVRGSFVPGCAVTSQHQPPAGVSQETPQRPIREITRADLLSVSLLPGGEVGIAYMVREEREQEQPRQRPVPDPRQTPTRPEDDRRRTDRPTQPRQGEQVKPAPNRQVRPK